MYIWNATQSTQLVAELKRIRPDVIVIVGGPEVSYEVEQQEICRLADFVVTGEADLAFAELCRKLLTGQRPLMKVIAADLPEFSSGPLSLRERVRVRGASDSESLPEGRPPHPGPLPEGEGEKRIALPYHLYTDADIAHRVIYVEASRGVRLSVSFVFRHSMSPCEMSRSTNSLPRCKNCWIEGCRISNSSTARST